ncbi:MAG: lysylphosphatidylglycerol synthase domain-containing protein [Gemmatimonadaceae bacterium]|nr:lysylphosphatidylglycerol synthase domain-containing protein [Gemmatimonadaceae bacterium]
MRAEGRTALRLLVAGIIGFFVFRFLAREWSEIRVSAVALQPSWSGIVLASLCILAGYAMLIAAWRLLLRTWRSPLGLVDASRIWFVSSLGKYVPGKLWSIGAMAVLAKESGASPVAATGSAIIMQLVNLAAGFVVVALAGAGDLLVAYPVLRMAAWLTVGLSVLALGYGPALLTWTVQRATRLLRRPMPEMPDIPRATLVLVFVANVAAWIAYGIGFGIFWTAVLGRGGGVSLAALAVYTASYLLGFLALFAPGGLGVREAVLAGLLLSLTLATPADAALLAATSGIWLRVLEVIPGLLFLPGVSLRRRSSISHTDGPAA